MTACHVMMDLNTSYEIVRRSLVQAHMKLLKTGTEGPHLNTLHTVEASTVKDSPRTKPPKQPPDSTAEQRQAVIRKNSFSLLEPEASMIPSLVDLSQQDYDVNAPLGLNTSLLQGQDLLMALETSAQ
uniref:Uncharacterized protein n=1 Tax=Timema shepardi TaxID=629360 RepID=A0A7R9AVZ7_TIMSH|nr:unnamed protein product [Timema shepardi]